MAPVRLSRHWLTRFSGALCSFMPPASLDGNEEVAAEEPEKELPTLMEEGTTPVVPAITIVPSGSAQLTPEPPSPWVYEPDDGVAAEHAVPLRAELPQDPSPDCGCATQPLVSFLMLLSMMLLAK